MVAQVSHGTYKTLWYAYHTASKTISAIQASRVTHGHAQGSGIEPRAEENKKKTESLLPFLQVCNKEKEEF